MVDIASKLTKLVKVDSKEATVVTEAIIQAALGGRTKNEHSHSLRIAV